ncbi:MAG: hypothetical protein HYW90_03545 [Candidatus Sungbacteria bacterium]|nr:hypothetical protein [Candidatus Sungbacteria bacterium]
MPFLRIICLNRLENLDMLILSTLVGSIFGQDKEIGYFEGGKTIEIVGDVSSLRAVQEGVYGHWPVNARFQELALGFYPGGLKSWHKDFPRLMAKVTDVQML